MKQSIRLHTDSILHVRLDKHEENFKFIVNGIEYQTTKIFAEIISPKISKILLNDPTFNEFQIETQNKGDFNIFLKLQNFEDNYFKNSDINFIIEIIELLGNEKILINIPKEQINNINILDKLLKHEENPQFYQNEYNLDIEYTSAHFDSIIKNEHDEIKAILKLKIDTLIQILSHEKFSIDSEDDVLNFVNKLYLQSNEYFVLYEYVFFENVEIESIKEFVSIFDMNDMTASIWKSISKRLTLSHPIQTYGSRYKNKEIKYSKDDFSGIFNFFRKHSKIQDEVKITSSSVYSGNLQKILQIDDPSNDFCTQNDLYQWICFEFVKHKIKPKNYTIRSNNWSSKTASHLRSWTIEGSNDLEKWDILSEEEDSSYLNGPNHVHTFPIKNQNEQSYKYIRILQTESNWGNNMYLSMNSFEIYGQINYQ